MPKKIDWDEIERRFVQGNETLRELAVSCMVSERSVFRHSTEGNWPQKKTAYQLAQSSRRTQYLTVLHGAKQGPKEPREKRDPKVVPEPKGELEARLVEYREVLRERVEGSQARSLESLIQTLLKVEAVHREWFPVSNEAFFFQFTQGLIDRGLTFADYIAYMREIAATAT